MAWSDLLSSTTPSGSTRRSVPPASDHASQGGYGSSPDSPWAADTTTRDLELMHHYCVSSCETMALREDIRYVWRVVFPQDGYRHRFVMHGLLALSALHKAYLFPAKRQEYLNLSASHHTLGLERFRALLSDVGEDNWRAMLCFAWIIVVHVCSLAARSENGCIAAPITSTWELFSVVRGINATMEEFTSRVSQTNLAPLIMSMLGKEKAGESTQWFVTSLSGTIDGPINTDKQTKSQTNHLFIAANRFSNTPRFRLTPFPCSLNYARFTRARNYSPTGKTTSKLHRCLNIAPSR